MIGSDMLQCRMRVASSISLTDSDRSAIQKLARGRSTASKVVLRAKIVLLAAQGLQNQDIAFELSTSVHTVGLWRNRYIEQGVPGLQRDASRPGRPRVDRRALEQKIVE